MENKRRSFRFSHEQVLREMDKSLSSVSQIVFFLISAMAIVETVDAHEGFSFITVLSSFLSWFAISTLASLEPMNKGLWAQDRIRTTDRRMLLVLISLVTFFLSSLLDNLTTTIVMCSLIGKLIPKDDPEARKVIACSSVASRRQTWKTLNACTLRLSEGSSKTIYSQVP